jgi:hypothetical protein
MYNPETRFRHGLNEGLSKPHVLPWLKKFTHQKQLSASKF